MHEGGEAMCGRSGRGVAAYVLIDAADRLPASALMLAHRYQ
ncbi:hypothetical protein GFS60_04978 [Rhodococcus sp. WAY2]|nr:hypothetical protein GFS60_04978 [Rhodococcus sp. WAY2]